MLICLCTSNVSKSQTVLDTLNWQLRAYFQNLSKPTPPRLFLYDMAAHIVDSNYFDNDNYVDTMDIETFKAMYVEMKNSAYDTIPFEPIDTVMWRTYKHQPDTVSMLLMRYDYYELKPNAMSTNIYFDFDTINNILSDKAVRPGYPYDIKRLFVMTPNKHLISRSQITYFFNAANFFKDDFNGFAFSGETNPHEIEVNFHEGSGWHTISTSLNEYITVNYPTNGGKYPIEVRIKYNGNIIDYSVSYMNKKPTRAGALDFPNQELSMFGMNINIYEPCEVSHPEGIKTLIYLEGFDILDFSTNLNREAQEIYTEQILETSISDLRNFGYRIMVVDWQNSRIKIQENADNLLQLLNFINCQNQNTSPPNTEETAIIGESMGGLVAKYALLKAEQDGIADGCTRDHRVRLLLTFDTPHDGAHIPMSIQLVYRYFRNHFPFGLISGMPYYFLGNYSYLTYNDMFLESDAAKQMLIDHVSTQSLFGPHTFHEHNLRDDLVNEFTSMGEKPQFCKVVASSNGNMAGFGQTRYWDGAPRVAGDRLLHARSEVFVRFLGQRLPIIGFDIRMNTDPNGIGNLGSLNYGTWAIKLKLKWFGIKIYTDYNSLCNKDWHGNMQGISTSSGGLEEFNTIIETNILNDLPYTGQGTWEEVNNNSLTRVRTDGFGWCFIPTASALHFGPGLNLDFDGMSINNLLNNEPFDVVYGIVGNDQNAPQPTANVQNFNINTFIRNRGHLNVRNDALIDLANSATYFYNIANIADCDEPPIRMVNREIGDDEIRLENREVPWDASLSIVKNIYVNEKNKFYAYASGTDPQFYLGSIYSKENPFIISSGINTYTLSVNGNPSDIIYYPPITGASDIGSYAVLPCCSNYLKQPLLMELKSDDVMIFPNPVSNHKINIVMLQSNDGKLEVTLSDILGKNIIKTELLQQSPNAYCLQLNDYTKEGLYILKIRVGTNKFFNYKILIQ